MSKEQKEYPKLNILGVESSAKSNANWRHGVGVTKSVFNGEERISIGNTWYPENGTAFARGAASLTMKEAIEFAKMIIEATKLPAPNPVSTASANQTYAGKRGRPKGSKNKPKDGSKTETPVESAQESSNEQEEAVLAGGDSINEALKSLGLSEEQMKEIGL